MLFDIFFRVGVVGFCVTFAYWVWELMARKPLGAYPFPYPVVFVACFAALWAVLWAITPSRIWRGAWMKGDK